MVELAVFGAVLFFLIGAITLNYISGAFQQNSQLQSMRWALLKSYQASKAGSAARTSGSFLVFEDRLTGEFGKYGSLDRQPIVSSGSGMMTAQAMQVNDWGGPDIVPLIDVTVNGEAFVFRASAYATYVVARKGDGSVQIIQVRAPLPNSKTEQYSVGGYCSGSYVYCSPGSPYAQYQCGSGGSCVEQFATVTYNSVDEIIKAPVQSCLGGGGASGDVIDCNVGRYKDPKTGQWVLSEQLVRLAREWAAMPKHGMPPLFTRMPANDPLFTKVTNNNVAFNLTRTTNGLIFPYPARTPAWRWSWDYAWEPIPGESDEEKKKNIRQKFIDKEVSTLSYDIDGDLREETLYDVKDVTKDFCTGSCVNAYRVNVLDPKLADIDPEKGPKDFSNPDEKPGMRPGMKIYGSASGTYLDVKEGKLYSNGSPVAVSTLQKNQFDVVEREYQMNINMGDVAGFLALNPNVANGCGVDTFKGTCFDSGTKTLHIRSRLSDQRGRKWITDTNRTWNQSLGGN